MNCCVVGTFVAVVAVNAGKVLLLDGRLQHKLRDEDKQRPHGEDGHVHVEEPPEQDKVGGHCGTKVTLHLPDVCLPEFK